MHAVEGLNARCAVQLSAVQLRWWLVLVVLGASACGGDDDGQPTGQAGMPSLAGGSGGSAVPPPPAPAASGSAAMTGSAPSGSSGNAGTSASAAGATAAGTGGSVASGGMMSAADAGMESDEASSTPAGACTRESLSAAVDQYFVALAAHDSKMLPLGDTVKFTENGDELDLDKGLWMNAGMVKFKHSAFDTEICNSVTEAVVPAGMTDIPFGLRLKLEAGKITEIESIAVRSGDYFVASSTKAISDTASEDWEALLGADKRSTRDELTKIVDDYFTKFPAGACNFADDCRRLENGFSPGNCSAGLSCSTSSSGGSGGMKPRLHVLDVEAGIAVGFVMFAGSYTDFHMFRVSGGEVHGVHAVLASADGPGWD